MRKLWIASGLALALMLGACSDEEATEQESPLVPEEVESEDDDLDEWKEQQLTREAFKKEKVPQALIDGPDGWEEDIQKIPYRTIDDVLYAEYTMKYTKDGVEQFTIMVQPDASEILKATSKKEMNGVDVSFFKEEEMMMEGAYWQKDDWYYSIFVNPAAFKADQLVPFIQRLTK